MMNRQTLPTPQERLLVVRDPGSLARFIRGRYPQFDVAVTPTYLAGIAALAQGPARGLLVGVDPVARKLHQAVAGLRKAAGPSSRVVLCCTPSGEPAARDAVAAGADDYLIYPLNGDELDQALGLPTPGVVPGDLTPTETLPTWDELTTLAGVLSGIGQGRKPMLDRLCQLVADSMRAPSVRIVVEGNAASVGDSKFEPTLVETISAGGRNLGQILVGPRHRSPFSAAEVEKLGHYGRLIAHLLEAADRQDQWQTLATIDEATGLPNRRYLMQALESVLQQAAVKRFRVTALIFDLDGFKRFNDTYGHSAGDEILRDTGRLFRKCCRPHDVVARYGGDEFVVVFWDAQKPRIAGSKHPTDALVVLRRFKKALESHDFPKLGPEARGYITISGGLASFPWDARDGQGLIDRADQALLQAKRAGKNRIYLVGSKGEPVEEPDASTPT